MKKLIDLKDESLGNGCIFRLPARWPYEKYVDFMLAYTPRIFPDRNYTLIVTTGQKAGLMLYALPGEAESQHWKGIETQWLITNWAEHIYPECPVEEVFALPKYELIPSRHHDCPVKIKR